MLSPLTTSAASIPFPPLPRHDGQRPTRGQTIATSEQQLTLSITPKANTGLKVRLTPTRASASAALHQQIASLLALRPLDVELDLSDVNCITGSLVTLLMSLRRNVTEYGGHFHITAAHPLVRELFHRTGLDIVLQIDQPAHA